MMTGRGWHHLSPADRLAGTRRQLSGGTLGPTHEGGRSRGRWCRTDPPALTTQNWRPRATPALNVDMDSGQEREGVGTRLGRGC